ncbi:MAG: Bug family tripartite tricarboxylate transporter substrate binding protein [Lautropia sp.]
MKALERIIRCARPIGLLLALALVAGPARVEAQTAAPPAAEPGYPSKTIRFVVGFAPGGGTDIIARLLALKLSQAWGQQVVVENRPGATGMLGASVVATSPADGYTILMGHVNSNAIAPSLSQKPLYDPTRDFAAVAYVGYVPNVLVVNAKSPARTIAELLALAKSRPEGLTFASPGAGSTNHLAGELLRNQSGAKLIHVPYKGSGPAIVDLLGGQIDMNFDAMSSVVPYLKAGTMRALAVTTAQRDPDLAAVPTMAESGYKDFEMTNWYGVMAPAGTPAPIVQKLNGELNRIMTLPDVAPKLDELGVRRNAMSAAGFADFIRAENARYRNIAKVTGVQMQ